MNDSHLQSVGKYIDQHPNKMSVLLKKNSEDEFDVIYANVIAMDYFSSESNRLASLFFGVFWTKINRQMKNLKSITNYTTEINHTMNEKKYLFEITFQKNNNLDHEVIYIELRERLDILEEKSLRDQLHEKYVSVINHNMDPIITINKQWKITYANPSVHTTYGYKAKELSDRSILNLVTDVSSDQFHELIKDGFLGKSIDVDEIYIYKKNGEYLQVHLKAIPVSSDGEVTELHLIVRDTSLNQENNEKLRYLSYHDQLTGLWNRSAMKEHFITDSLNAKKSAERMSYIHIGLDRFKLINDSLGHTGADTILKMVADRVKVICPQIGRLYRKGGDEFVITLQGNCIAVTEKLAQQILNEFSKPFYFNHQEYFISASIGISVYPEDASTFEELLKKSEQALSFVKDRGRSQFRFYQDEMNSIVSDEVLMESHLRRAIEMDELRVYYQPQVNLKTGAISSFEALLRWDNKKFGFVSPAKFIPIAEESGLIHSIGDWVLNQVCKHLRDWQDKQYRPVRIAVNISPKQFRVETFVENMQKKIESYGILPSSLEVEITENALTSVHETLTILNMLKEIGVIISVDDFGTGYSSLSYLKKYPIDIIKIDRSFIQDIEVDDKNKAIAKTIINLAYYLNMEVIAEGVETELQASILLGANCQKAQGFLYSKAIPVDELVEKYFYKNVTV